MRNAREQNNTGASYSREAVAARGAKGERRSSAVHALSLYVSKKFAASRSLTMASVSSLNGGSGGGV